MQYRVEQNVFPHEGAVGKEGAGGLGEWVLDTGVLESRGLPSEWNDRGRSVAVSGA